MRGRRAVYGHRKPDLRDAIGPVLASMSARPSPSAPCPLRYST
jgi:hypothetical protein